MNHNIIIDVRKNHFDILMSHFNIFRDESPWEVSCGEELGFNSSCRNIIYTDLLICFIAQNKHQGRELFQPLPWTMKTLSINRDKYILNVQPMR